jgi:hypothetical protein
MDVLVRESEREVQQRVDAAKAKAAELGLSHHTWFDEKEA